MFYNIPEKMQKQIIDLFSNTNLIFTRIIKLVDPNSTIPKEAFYEFIENYKDSNENKLERPHKPTTNKYKEIIESMEVDNKKNRIEEKKKEMLELKEAQEIQKVENEIPEEILENEKYVNVYDDIIVEMDNNGWALPEIRDYFLNLGLDVFDEIDINSNGIRTFRKIDDKIDKMIFDLRIKGKSYREISQSLKNKGIKLSYETIRKLCRNFKVNEKVCDNNSNSSKEKMPKSKKSLIKEDDVYNLRKKGYTYEEISNYYKELQIDIHPCTISKISKGIFRKLQENEPSMRRGYKRDIRRIKSKTDLQSMVYEIAKRKKATQIQLEQFMDEVSIMYNVDLRCDREEEKER